MGSSTEDPNQQTAELNDVRPHAILVVFSEGRKHFGAGFFGKIPEIPAKKIVK